MKRLLAAAIVLAPGLASAHLAGVPTTAWFTAPDEVGIAADGSFEFAWTDYDDQATTGSTTIDFYYSAEMPPTFRMGAQPRGLTGTPILKGVAELDLANKAVWDTSEVPAGTWFLWSIAHDPPFEMVAFSRGSVTVAHPGDPIHPAILLATPSAEGDVADASYEIQFQASDPDGTGRVTLEVTSSPDGSNRTVIAEDLDPAAGSFTWDTSALEEGDWMVRASITDGRGFSHTAWGRFFVRIDHAGAGGAGGTAGSGGGGAAGSGGGGEGGTAGSAGEGGTGGPPTDDFGNDGSSGGSGCAASCGTGIAALAFAFPFFGRRRHPRG